MNTRSSLHNILENIRKVAGKQNSIFPAIVFVLLHIAMAYSIENSPIPDFAYPKDVEKESEVKLENFIKQNNQEGIIRSALNISIARNLVSEKNSLPQTISLLDSISSFLVEDYKRVVWLIEADLFKGEYNSNRYLYDNRELPADSIYPKNPLEWNGNLYKEKILQLVDRATNRLDNDSKKSLEGIKNLLAETNMAEAIKMTESQFIVFKGEEILHDFTTDIFANVIPFFPNETGSTIEGRCDKKCKSLLLLVSDSLAQGNTIVQAIAFRKYSDLLMDQDRQSYLKEKTELLKNTRGEGYLLFSDWEYFQDADSVIYNRMTDWLSQYPDEFYSSQIRFAINKTSRPRISVSLPPVAYPGKSIEGKATISNLSKGYLLVYKLNKGQYNEHDQIIPKKFNPSDNPLEIIELEGNGEIPFSSEKSITISSLSPGLYAVIPSKERKLKAGWFKTNDCDISTLRVTSISILSTFNSSEKGSGRIYVVDGMTQRPLDGAVVEISNVDTPRKSLRLSTNSNGYVEVSQGYYVVAASYQGSEAKTEAGISYYSPNSATSYHICILTDLSVYQSGDTLKYAAIGWAQEKTTDFLMRDTNIEVILRDPNYEEVGSDIICLNKEGRASGYLIIPGERLLGNYVVEALYTDSGKKGSGFANVLVEDYRQPSYFVTLGEPSEVADTLVFKGEVKTFSGLPVSNAKVTIDIRYQPWFRGLASSSATYKTVTETVSDGSYYIKLPSDGLKNTIFEHGRFSVGAEAVSPWGESQKSSILYFSLGRNHEIRPEIPEKVEIIGDSLTLNIPVYDAAGYPVITNCVYTFVCVEDPEIKIKGNFISPKLQIASTEIPSGKYKIILSPTEGETVETETVFWRTTDTKIPYETPLWIPLNEYVYNETQNEISVKFGGMPDGWILYILSDDEKILDTEWIHPALNLTEKIIEIPSENHTLFVNLFGLYSFKSLSGNIKILPKKDKEMLEIETVSFRENISTGTEEKWEFRYSVGDKPAGELNVFAVMSDKALNSINDFKWNLNMWKPESYSKVNIRSQYYGLHFSNVYFGKNLTYPNSPVLIPGWQAYGYPLLNGFRRLPSGGVIYNSYSMKTLSSNIKMEVEMEEEADEAKAMTTQGIAIDGEEISLRPVEMPMAFFHPDMTTNDKGELTIDLKVPDYNTTWQLQIAAYNEKLQNCIALYDVVASKEVMVKSRLPKYLLTGDHAQISALIYNNSKDSIKAGGKIEILDPASGIILKEETYGDEYMDPGDIKEICLEFDVPSDLSVVAVRCYATSAGNSDGEQGFINILPSSMPIIESILFYAEASDTILDLKIPRKYKDSNITFKYTDEPVWELLMDMPSPSSNEANNSLDIVKDLFGTIVASNIIERNPVIKNNLTKIFASEDSTLTLSKLQKDESLKLTQLPQTPWVNDAYTETARINDLILYMNEEAVQKLIKEIIELLETFQTESGGWSWVKGMNGSAYITSEILSSISWLKRKGILAAGMDQMYPKAVKYMDTYILENKENNKRLDLYSTMRYLYSRNILTTRKCGKIARIEKECVDSILNNWQKWSVENKAYGALLLKEVGGFQDKVQKIVRSLTQFISAGLTNKEKTLLLQIFNENESEQSFVNDLVKSILLSKETTTFSRDLMNVVLTGELLNSLSGETYRRSVPKINIGNEEIVLSESQSLTGNYTINLEKENVGKTVRIEREGGTVAWGGVVSQYIAPTRQIKEELSESISIKKRIFVTDTNGDLKESLDFKKGDKVSVSLNIRCDKDMDFVVIKDTRAACLAPDDAVSGICFKENLWLYQEMREDHTSFFIERLPAGNYLITYTCHADRDGEYSLGIAEIQSLYTPTQTAHSSGKMIRVRQ